MAQDEGFWPSALTVLAISVTVFLTETVVMTGLVRLHGETTSYAVVVFDATLLAVFTAPVIYFLVRIPVRRELERRLEAEKRAETMSRLAMVDPLTRILNRRGITAALLEAMASAERYEHPLTIALADVDHFKQVNDRFGHEAGDRVIASLAAIFAERVRESDRVGRYGGDEFLFVLPETALDMSRPIVDRVCARVRDHSFDVGVRTIGVTVSMGVTQFEVGEEPAHLFARVDNALYEAKHNGLNLVVLR